MARAATVISVTWASDFVCETRHSWKAEIQAYALILYPLCLLSDRFGANSDSKLQLAKEGDCNRQMENKSREELFGIRTASARYPSLLKPDGASLIISSLCFPLWLLASAKVSGQKRCPKDWVSQIIHRRAFEIPSQTEPTFQKFLSNQAFRIETPFNVSHMLLS